MTSTPKVSVQTTRSAQLWAQAAFHVPAAAEACIQPSMTLYSVDEAGRDDAVIHRHQTVRGMTPCSRAILEAVRLPSLVLGIEDLEVDRQIRLADTAVMILFEFTTRCSCIAQLDGA